MNNLIKTCTLWMLVFWGITNSYGQDIGVVAKLSPNSGCQLGSSETVTVQIFNFGSTFTSPFDVSYQINGNTPVTETVNLGTFNTSSSYSHTFVVNADLSTPGTYIMKFYTSLAGDANNLNDTLTASIVNDPLTVGGTLPSDFSVCELGNSGTLTLSGYVGSVLDWEITTDGGSTWSSLSNTTDSESYLNLTQATGYRAVVKSGLCAQDYSSEVHISIDQESIGGAVSGPASICTPPNAATISLSGMQGSIVDWEISTDGGTTWSFLGDNSNPLNQNNLAQTSSYRAEVQNGSCPSVYSDTFEVVVVSNLNGGILDPSLDSVCVSSNSGTINLLSHLGTIDHWEYSNDLVNWNTITNTTTSHSFSNLTDTTYYRVIVSDCTTDTSTIAQINVNTPSIAGSIPVSIDACQGDDVTGIVSSGIEGNMLTWESSTDGTNWSAIATQSSLDVLGVSNSQFIRLIAANGACDEDTSNVLTINVSSAPSFSSSYSPDSLCISVNNDSIVFFGVNATVTDWIYSENAGSSWTSLSVSDSILNISPVISTTYGVIIESGTCPADTFYTDVHVSENSVAGSIPTDTTLCLNTDSLTITNSGYLGDIVWYASSNLAGPYTIINSGSSSVSFSTNDFEYLYANVTNGACSATSTDTLTVDFYSANYGITGDTLVGQFESTSFQAFGGTSYQWESNTYMSDLTNPSQTVELSEQTTFTVHITDINGCVYTDSITLNLLNENLQIATIITPNNDGFNDAWVIKSPESSGEINVTVTNSFGQVVFSDSDYQSDWMGDFGGQPLPSGAYYFVVEVSTGETIYGTLNILTNE